MKIKKTRLLMVLTVLLFHNNGYTGAPNDDVLMLNNNSVQLNNIKQNINVSFNKVQSNNLHEEIINNKNNRRVEWVKYSDLNDYYKKEFNEVAQQYFKEQSYEELTKNKSICSLTQEEKKILQDAMSRAQIQENRDTILKKEVIPVKAFLSRMENTNAFSILVYFIKDNIDSLKKCKQVNFKQIFEKMSSNMESNIDSKNQLYKQSDIDLISSNTINNIKNKQSLIYFALSSIYPQHFQHKLGVNEKGKKIDLLFYKGLTYENCIDTDYNVMLKHVV